MKGQTVVLCPQCGGNKVRESNITRTLGAMTFIYVVTIIGIPLAIISGLIWIFMKLTTRNNKPMVCEECKYRFRVNKSTIKQYKNVIKQNEASL
jgi:hypothetical protein